MQGAPGGGRGAGRAGGCLEVGGGRGGGGCFVSVGLLAGHTAPGWRPWEVRQTPAPPPRSTTHNSPLPPTHTHPPRHFARRHLQPSGREARARRRVQPSRRRRRALQSCARTPRCHPAVFADFPLQAKMCGPNPAFPPAPNHCFESLGGVQKAVLEKRGAEPRY